MNEITYTKVGDYYLPDLALPEQSLYHIGKYGRQHRKYLKENKNGFYTGLLLSGKLSEYLHEIDITATEQVELMIIQLTEKKGITEQLKATDQMAWVGAMNTIKNQAEEIVML